MSVAHNRFFAVRYQWGMRMIPWYRQALSLVYGVGVMLIALWALDQGTGTWMILGVVGMSMLTLVLIFGIEIDEVSIGDKVHIDFTDTSERDPDDDE